MNMLKFNQLKRGLNRYKRARARIQNKIETAKHFNI